MTKTDNDGVKIEGYRCNRKECREPSLEPHVHGGILLVDYDNPLNTPLISALDEAGVVDGLCPCLGLWGKDTGPTCLEGNMFCPCGYPDYADRMPSCRWKGHAHADKLRGMK